MKRPAIMRGLKRFSRRIQKDQVEGVNFDGNRLAITPVKAAPLASAENLVSQIEAMMPRIRITELLAAILADATNLGLSRMARASEGITRDQLI